MPNAANESIIKTATSVWGTATLATAARFDCFRHIEEGATTAGLLAERAQISTRGAQALLDGLVALGLVARARGGYANGEAARALLAAAGPDNHASFAQSPLRSLERWAKFPDVVKSGKAAATAMSVPAHPFWVHLVLGIAPVAISSARAAAAELGIAGAGAVRLLDVGGGAGVYSAVWLGQNPEARSTQLDWPNVNAVAREYVGKFGVSDRFATVDGDIVSHDFGPAAYDHVVYSHIAHGFAPETNQAVLKRLRSALRPGGTLVVADFIVDDDRTGPPLALLFAADMLLNSDIGNVYTKADFSGWLRQAGFDNVRFTEPDAGGVTLAYAR